MLLSINSNKNTNIAAQQSYINIRGTNITALRLMVVFYQLQAFTTVPADHGSKLFRNLHTVIGMVFQMKIFDLEQSQYFDFLRNVCVYNDLTFTKKNILTIALWSLLLFGCALVSIIQYCVTQFRSVQANISGFGYRVLKIVLIFTVFNDNVCHSPCST